MKRPVEDLLGRIIPAALALTHMVLHLRLHIVKFFLLVIIQYFTNLAGGGFMQTAHLRSPVIGCDGIILHDFPHLALRVFNNWFDFGLLIAGEIQSFCQVFELILQRSACPADGRDPLLHLAGAVRLAVRMPLLPARKPPAKQTS